MSIIDTHGRIGPRELTESLTSTTRGVDANTRATEFREAGCDLHQINVTSSPGINEGDGSGQSLDQVIENGSGFVCIVVEYLYWDARVCEANLSVGSGVVSGMDLSRGCRHRPSGAGQWCQTTST